MRSNSPGARQIISPHISDLRLLFFDCITERAQQQLPAKHPFSLLRVEGQKRREQISLHFIPRAFPESVALQAPESHSYVLRQTLDTLDWPVCQYGLREFSVVSIMQTCFQSSILLSRIAPNASVTHLAFAYLQKTKQRSCFDRRQAAKG